MKSQLYNTEKLELALSNYDASMLSKIFGSDVEAATQWMRVMNELYDFISDRASAYLGKITPSSCYRFRSKYAESASAHNIYGALDCAVPDSLRPTYNTWNFGRKKELRDRLRVVDQLIFERTHVHIGVARPRSKTIQWHKREDGSIVFAWLIRGQVAWCQEDGCCSNNCWHLTDEWKSPKEVQIDTATGLVKLSGEGFLTLNL